MKDSIQKYFKVGTIQWMSYPKCDAMESLKAICKDPYFDAIELRGYGEDNVAAKALLDQSHLKVCYGAQPRLIGKCNPNAIDEDERKKAETTLMEAIDEAEYLGAEAIAFLSGKWHEETKEDAYKQLLKTTRNVCSYAAGKGMSVELEVFDFDMDKASLIFPTTYETSQFVIRTLRPYITHFHFGNAVVKPGCEAYGDKHPRMGYPDSANDTEELVDYLRGGLKLALCWRELCLHPHRDAA